MKIPIEVKIGGHKVTVELISAFEEGRKNVVGRAMHGSKKIILSQESRGEIHTESYTAENFLHELLHHIDLVYNVKLTEGQVRRLSEGLFQVLVDNDLDFKTHSSLFKR